jgi:hypothetical protein
LLLGAEALDEYLQVVQERPRGVEGDAVVGRGRPRRGGGRRAEAGRRRGSAGAERLGMVIEQRGRGGGEAAVSPEAISVEEASESTAGKESARKSRSTSPAPSS